MRKSSKLLALLLTLCLLFGAITAIFASAEEGEATPVGGDTIKTESTTLTGNSNRTPLGGAYTEASDLKNFDYITVDLDITVPADNPNYHPGLVFQPNTQTVSQVATKKHAAFASFAMVEEDGALYLGEVNENAKISETPGVYDHITVICKINKTGEGDTLLASSITTYLYVNGKYVKNVDSAAFTEAAAFTRFAIKKPNATGAFDEGCAITFEMTACSYNAGSERAAALAAVLESGVPLYTTDSYAVVYNSDYVTPDAATNYVKVNGTPYTLVGKAMDEISKLEGDNNKITVIGRNLSVTLPDSVKKIEVTLENGAKFDAGESFVKEATEEENVYIYNRVVTMPTGDYTNAPYKWAASLTGNTNAEPHFRTASYDAKKNLKLFDYVVYDFEMTVTEGLSFPSGLIFKSNATTSTPSSGNKGLGNFAVVAKDGNYYMYKASEASKLSNDSSVFDKLTFVYEMGKDTDGNLASVTLYLFVNGNYVAQTTTALSGDYGLARLQIQDSDGWSSEGVTFKNINIHSYYSDGATISGTSTDLDGQTADGKKAAALEEYLKSIASITVGEESYINITEAEAALKLLKDGSTITLNNMNVANFNTTLKSFNVIAANGTETFTLDADCAWRYLKSGNNYKRVIDGQVLANLELNSQRMTFKFYFPVPEEGTLKYVKSWTNATDTEVSEGNKNLNNNIRGGATYMYDYDGDGVKEEYIVVYWQCRTDMLSTTAYPEFTYNGETLLGRSTANFNVVTYAKKVVETNDCGSQESQLARALMDYNVEFMKAAGKSDDAAAADSFYAIFDGHTNCKCGNVDTVLEAEGDYIKVGTAQENFAFPTGVSVTYGMNSEKRLFNILVNSTLENGNLVKIEYVNVNNKTVTLEEVISDTSGNAVFQGIGAYDADNELKITVYNVTYGKDTDEEGNEIEVEVSREVVVETFTYSLADYDVTAAGDLANLVKAFKNYAMAAENYKVDPKEN